MTINQIRLNFEINSIPRPPTGQDHRAAIRKAMVSPSCSCAYNEVFFFRLNTHKGSHLLLQSLWSRPTFLCVFQRELRGKSWISARSRLQTRDTTVGLTAPLWNVGCCFSAHSPAHDNPTRPALHQTSARIYLNVTRGAGERRVHRIARERRETETVDG